MNKIPRNIFTIYGRKPVLEALLDPSIQFFRVHLADSNREGGIIDDICKHAKRRQVEIVFHDRMALSRISKNKKQDQGVAADIVTQNFAEFSDYLNDTSNANASLLAVDNITNPQNLGMIIRSVCAGTIDGLILPRKGCARLDPLVNKASAGTLFKTQILFCDSLVTALEQAKKRSFSLYSFSGTSPHSIENTHFKYPNIFIIGNETEGVSTEVARLCEQQVRIPMRNGVESLNVSVAAGILCFLRLFKAH
jgi:23S rRNA (guanosine2251-2'-O)-methyltransferase